MMLCFILFVALASMSNGIVLSFLFFFRGPGNLHYFTLFVFFPESDSDRT